MTDRQSACEFIEQLVDHDSYTSWDEAIDLSSTTAEYAAELHRASQRTGADESILTGRGVISGRPAALIVSEFGFLGGSIGQAAARRIIMAIERATRERLPLIAAPSSGGTRMQEGTPAFVAMIPITAAIGRHKSAGLPYVTYLRHPTTGGALASWASLGQVTYAEPGALIGFLGPRVFAALTGTIFPANVQLAENLVEHGIIDAVVPVGELPATLARTIDRLSQTTDLSTRAAASEAEPPRTRTPVWESVLATRRADRAGARELLQHLDEVLPLSGTNAGERDRGGILALASIQGISCVLVAQARTDPQSPAATPAGLRQARRGIRLADELGLAFVTVIDTSGAELSAEAEQGALAGEIARTIADFTALTVPSVSILLGQGTGGAALALFAGRRIVAAEHAWLSPLPPEGASAIVHGTTIEADRMAAQQQIGAWDLLDSGLIHRVVPESESTSTTPLARDLVRACGELLHEQLALVPQLIP